MEPLRIHQGLVCPLDRSNVDTDQIIPKQFLKRIERSGFGQFLFYNWRFDDDGNPRPDFPLNAPEYNGASILVAGENFGCGSSREHAPWAIQDFGFKIIIAPSYADIFKNNCVKNGILAIQATEEQVQTILKKAETTEGYSLTVNLEEQVVSDNEGFDIHFDIAPYPKEMLLNGWDEIGVTLKYEDKIKEYEQAHA
ncbi:3-isopropylmalate dehydratase small subunit [Neobacillus mesonae]|uniref:3-isopropylmalate dehydratase small subunit n=1 Tax=Neobacillus mesonae TaxID=1193713 RepID=UPI00204080B7|nr:3-isopropylmalate dehydratase small subunit [Neobacillus mesonae]MCM3569749.1 3-isopropylmalate dehydratase small subunit [Neobacillus mesonae]